MKKVLTSLIAFVAIATMAMAANAAVSVTLKSPAEGDVTNPGHFPTIVLDAGDAIEQVTELTMTPETGDPVSCPFAFSFNSFALEVDCSGVTKSGKWTLIIPAGALDLEGEANEEITYTWNYTNPTEGEAPAAIEFTAFTTNDEGGKIAPGGTIESKECLKNINLVMSEDGLTINNTSLQLTSDKGYDKNIAVNANMYNMGYTNQVIISVADEDIKESATYTLHVPAGFATSGARSSEAVDYSWTYTYTGNTGGGDTPSELEIKSLTVGGVAVSATTPLAAINPGDEIIVNIAPIAEAAMLTVDFRNISTDEAIRSFEIYDNPSNPDVVAKPAEGYYRTIASGAADNKFYNDAEYSITIKAYSTSNVGNPANIVWGPQVVTFTGATEPYKFSPVTIESITPAYGTEITDASQPIVITYSAPVTVDKVEASTGGQLATPVDLLAYATSNADKTVWTIKPDKSFWETSDTNWMFMIYAKDENGLVVKGNSGVDAGSYYEITYGCYMAWPTVAITPAAGMVEELYSFTIADASGIGLSYNYVPYVINEKGETVAKVDMDSQVQYDAKGIDISTLGFGDYIAVKATFNLTKPITEPGKYTLVSPRASYAIGTEFSGAYNRYFETEYTVVKMPKAKVDVELVNFASVSFEVLQGKNVTVALTPSADWKLASLTYNGDDVTTAVSGNAYTIEAVEADAKLVATYEYAHEIQTVQTSGVVDVAGKQVTVANDSDRISVEGVAAGDTIKVYTVNGMVIANVVAEQDIVKISCPAGQVYIVVINDKAVKIQH